LTSTFGQRTPGSSDKALLPSRTYSSEFVAIAKDLVLTQQNAINSGRIVFESPKVSISPVAKSLLVSHNNRTDIAPIIAVKVLSPAESKAMAADQADRQSDRAVIAPTVFEPVEVDGRTVLMISSDVAQDVQKFGQLLKSAQFNTKLQGVEQSRKARGLTPFKRSQVRRPANVQRDIQRPKLASFGSTVLASSSSPKLTDAAKLAGLTRITQGDPNDKAYREYYEGKIAKGDEKIIAQIVTRMTAKDDKGAWIFTDWVTFREKLEAQDKSIPEPQKWDPVMKIVSQTKIDDSIQVSPGAIEVPVLPTGPPLQTITPMITPIPELLPFVKGPDARAPPVVDAARLSDSVIEYENFRNDHPLTHNQVKFDSIIERLVEHQRKLSEVDPTVETPFNVFDEQKLIAELLVNRYIPLGKNATGKSLSQILAALYFNEVEGKKVTIISEDSAATAALITNNYPKAGFVASA
ncbi:MAG: hypothetical protein K8I00_01250, partial [Candidatus Omnitrophica bacterium]|nr:hypothetical protein [Candidatus Omnitrophota bacterium]